MDKKEKSQVVEAIALRAYNAACEPAELVFDFGEITVAGYRYEVTADLLDAASQRLDELSRKS